MKDESNGEIHLLLFRSSFILHLFDFIGTP
jgi:hypothetical protein